MDLKTNYKLNEQAQRDRLEDFTDDLSTAADLTRELALCRVLLEAAVEKGQGTLARDLLATIAALSRQHRIEETRRSIFIHKSVCIQLVRECGDIILDEFADVPGWEDRVERAQQKIKARIRGAKNPPALIAHLK